MITLSEISKSFGSRVLFENVTITFNSGNRYGLTGPNGAGKSTLLKIIMGLEEATSGSVSLPDKVGILRQNIEDFREFLVADVIIMGNKRLWNALKERDILYDVEMTDDVGMRLGEIEGIIAEENGYSADSEAEQFLAGMGIPEEYLQQKMHAIPTDMQFRVLLCQALFGEPQALLLDEPTNHLDAESIRWLETFLESFPGAVIFVTHDRYFLDVIATRIFELADGKAYSHPGNYTAFLESKAARQEIGRASCRERVLYTV